MTKSKYTKNRTLKRMHRFPKRRILRYPRYGLLGVLLLITLFLVPVTGHGGDTSAGDAYKGYQVKAVFLYNLINFVTWPDSTFKGPDSPFKICILGKDPFGGSLEKVIQGERVKGRRLVVERITDIKDLCACHILFISPSMENELPQILTMTRHEAVLTVGDVKGFTQKGGIVNLIPQKGRISIEVNPISAIEAGLIISAKLLNLAIIVTSRPLTENK